MFRTTIAILLVLAAGALAEAGCRGGGRREARQERRADRRDNRGGLFHRRHPREDGCSGDGCSGCAQDYGACAQPAVETVPAPAVLMPPTPMSVR